jgi:hypothetical protein
MDTGQREEQAGHWAKGRAGWTLGKGTRSRSTRWCTMRRETKTTHRRWGSAEGEGGGGREGRCSTYPQKPMACVVLYNCTAITQTRAEQAWQPRPGPLGFWDYPAMRRAPPGRRRLSAPRGCGLHEDMEGYRERRRNTALMSCCRCCIASPRRCLGSYSPVAGGPHHAIRI